MSKAIPFLSVVIPVFNEKEKIHKLKEVFIFLKKLKFTNELLVVDDGSTDRTLKILKSYQKKTMFKLISYSPNRGKGYALKQGMVTARGNYILFLDIDLSTPLSEFGKFIPHLKKFNLIIATRKNRKAQLIKRQAIIREELGKGFTKLSNFILGLNVSDFTCGFKCFNNESAKKIFNLIKVERWGFDSEVLFIANQKGYKIKEIPVKWSNDPNSKVKFPADLVNSFVDLIRIRFNHLRKNYN